jgi:ribA/ribD-fused uncharacterized protein
MMREIEGFYFFWRHQFGQWTKRDIVDPDGVTYNCCEQYMMHKKAMLFGDMEKAKEIIQEQAPSLQQQLGREIKNYSEAQWGLHKFGIVWYGNYLKFTQYNDLGERLMATGSKILAEASPYDLVWGVGYAAEDDDILDPKNWKGQNLLGEVLMSGRSVLRNAVCVPLRL